VGEGVVQSLARPGGNVTGLSDLHSDMLGKRLGILKEVVPSASRIAFLWNLHSSSGPPQLKELQAAAPAFGVTVLSLPVTGPDDIDRAFTQMRKERLGGLILHGNPLLGNEVVERVVKSQLPKQFQCTLPVINLPNAAKQLGLTISPNVLARADKVIK